MESLIVTAAIAAPWGPIRLAATARGLTALDQLVSADAFEARIERRFAGRGARTARSDDGPPDSQSAGEPRGADAAAHLREAVAAVSAFLAGDLRALEGLTVDLDDRPAWDRLVLGAVRRIAPGSTASHGEVARMIDKAGAARAVGGAVSRNPIGLVIPCHRVIAGDGTLGGYGTGWWGGVEAGLDLKRQLLAREGVRKWDSPAR
jgi:O-6-methylguanine DNA methyltransferase